MSTPYTREIRENAEESLSKVVSKVTTGSVVLDVGCSSGMLGQYLSERKGCTVDGIDNNEEALKICNPYYRKTTLLNLESDSLSTFTKAHYDYIVLADVIEHLVNPDNLLKELKRLLKPNGLLLISIPNVTHISVAFELLYGEFKYSDTGLLDSTHLKFYSKQSILDKLKEFGFYASEIDSVEKTIKETEFTDSPANLFPRHWVDHLMTQREDALTYQWIISAKATESEIHIVNKKRMLGQKVFSAELFWTSVHDDAFSSSRRIVPTLADLGEHQQVLDFAFTDSPSLSEIRVDPISDNGPFAIVAAEIIDTNTNISAWSFSPKQVKEELLNANIVKVLDNGTCICMSTNIDPQWLPKIDAQILKKVGRNWLFRLTLTANSDDIVHLLVQSGEVA